MGERFTMPDGALERFFRTRARRQRNRRLATAALALLVAAAGLWGVTRAFRGGRQEPRPASPTISVSNCPASG